MRGRDKVMARDRAYSNWHRYACADSATMIDIDGLEYCERCRAPLLLVEAARDAGQEKPTLVLEKLAEAAKIPAICLLWTPQPHWNPLPPHCECQRRRQRQPVPGCDHGIASFRWRKVWPERTEWQICTPEQMARWINGVHQRHTETAHELRGVA